MSTRKLVPSGINLRSSHNIHTTSDDWILETNKQQQQWQCSLVAAIQLVQVHMYEIDSADQPLTYLVMNHRALKKCMTKIKVKIHVCHPDHIADYIHRGI